MDTSVKTSTTERERWLAAMEQFDAAERRDGWDNPRVLQWAFEHEGRRYPLRRIVTMVSEDGATPGHQHQRVAAAERLGFTVVNLATAEPHFTWEIPTLSDDGSFRYGGDFDVRTDVGPMTLMLRGLRDGPLHTYLTYMTENASRKLTPTMIESGAGLKDAGRIFTSMTSVCSRNGIGYPVEYARDADRVVTYEMSSPIATAMRRAWKLATFEEVLTIVPEKTARAQWLEHGLYVFPVRNGEAYCDRLGFYEDGSIQPELPEILAWRMGTTIEDLEREATDGDEETAELVSRIRAMGQDLPSPLNVLILESHDSPDLRTLDHPIVCDKRKKNGDPDVWFFGHAAMIDASVLEPTPSVTSELDERLDGGRLRV